MWDPGGWGPGGSGGVGSMRLPGAVHIEFRREGGTGVAGYVFERRWPQCVFLKLWLQRGLACLETPLGQ